MKKAIIIAVLAVLVTGTIIIWLLNSEAPRFPEGILMISIQIVILVFAVMFVVKRRRANREKLPAEDEMSKKILIRSTASSYHVSLFMWLVVMYLDDKVNLECHELVGAGIMGMALIFAMSWIYYNYFRRSHD